MTWVAKTLHATPTGRAKPDGSRVTRKSGAVRRTKYAKGGKQDRPLGADHMVHPLALAPTPMHPGCATNWSQYNIKPLLDALDSFDFMTGVGLVRTSKDLGSDWLVVRFKGEPLGFAQSHAALAYRNAAAEKGVTLECYRDV